MKLIPDAVLGIAATLLCLGRALATPPQESLPEHVHWPAEMSSIPPADRPDVKKKMCNHGCTIWPDEEIDRQVDQLQDDANHVKALQLRVDELERKLGKKDDDEQAPKPSPVPEAPAHPPAVISPDSTNSNLLHERTT